MLLVFIDYSSDNYLALAMALGNHDIWFGTIVLSRYANKHLLLNVVNIFSKLYERDILQCK